MSQFLKADAKMMRMMGMAMSSKMRRLVGMLAVAAGLFLVIILPDARAQRGGIRGLPGGMQKSDDDKSAFTDAVTLPVNRESKRLIQAAQDYIKKKEWQVAVECLQSLLEGNRIRLSRWTAAPTTKARRPNDG